MNNYISLIMVFILFIPSFVFASSVDKDYQEIIRNYSLPGNSCGPVPISPPIRGDGDVHRYIYKLKNFNNCLYGSKDNEWDSLKKHFYELGGYLKIDYSDNKVEYNMPQACHCLDYADKMVSQITDRYRNLHQQLMDTVVQYKEQVKEYKQRQVRNSRPYLQPYQQPYVAPVPLKTNPGVR